MKAGLGYGLLNLGYFIQSRYQESFLPSPPSAPGGPPAVRTGNLRRSAYAVAAVDGRRIGDTGNVAEDIDMPPTGVVVGTNTGYGLYVEVGTERMQARPALVPAAIEGQQQAARLIEAGAKAHYRARP